MNIIHALINDERGIITTENAMVLALLTLSVAGTLGGLGVEMGNVMTYLSDTFANATAQSSPSV